MLIVAITYHNVLADCELFKKKCIPITVYWDVFWYKEKNQLWRRLHAVTAQKQSPENKMEKINENGQLLFCKVTFYM